MVIVPSPGNVTARPVGEEFYVMNVRWQVYSIKNRILNVRIFAPLTALTYCKENPNICENGGRCISLTKADGNYHCQCRQGYLGKNCEIVDEFMLTSTVAPRITPPPPLDWDRESAEDISENLISITNGTVVKIGTKAEDMPTNINKTSLENVSQNFNNTKIQDKESFNASLTIKTTVPTILLAKTENKFEDLANISGSDIIGTATTTMILQDQHNTKPTVKMEMPQSNIKTIANNQTGKAPIKTRTTTTTTTTPISPLSRLEEEQHQPTFMDNTKVSLTAGKPTKKPSPVENEQEDEDDDEDEECEDDNDEECEYEDEEDEDEEDSDDDNK